MRKLALCLLLIAGSQESIADMSKRLDKLEAKAQGSFDAYETAEKLSAVYEVVGETTDVQTKAENKSLGNGD